MKRLLALAFLAGLSSLAAAADDPNIARLDEKLGKLFEIKPGEIKPSPVPGLYEVMHEHEIAYVTADGKFLIHGDVTSVDTGEEITEERRRDDRIAALTALGDANFIDFVPKPPMAAKYIVTVFTDVDCGYCRKLHSQIADYLAKGIEIRYASWPRSGPDTPSWYRAEAVWCSSNRQAALTHAKLGMEIPLPGKCDNPVDQEYKLGMQLGVRGTPTMFMPDGELIPGYVPPDDLAKHLADAETTDKETADALAKAKGDTGTVKN